MSGSPRSTRMTYRPRGTGSVCCKRGKWAAFTPGDKESGHRVVTIASGLSFRKQAENALDEWLRLNQIGRAHV